MGPRNVVVKGGHLETASEAIDVLFDGREFYEFALPRITSHNTHGTGCTFASAIAAYLVKGEDVPKAVRDAKKYVSNALRAAQEQRLGQGHGPVDHFWFLPRNRVPVQLSTSQAPQDWSVADSQSEDNS
jgi:hydroxymethylpyrimidine kinase/phosphomethylpyrimidine kinase